MKHRFEKIEVIGAALVALLGIVFIAVAAAGVSKKGPPACSRDVWTCGDWSVCDGQQQTRVCTMSYDCPNVDTPKPDVTQTCAAAARGCDGAQWTCADWQACDADGMQARSCHLVSECPGLAMTRPDTKRECPTPQCENGTLRERMACRLELSAKGRAHLDSFTSVPEACRGLNDGGSRSACIAAFASFAPCDSDADADARLSCARTALGLSEDVTVVDDGCAALVGAQKTACLASVRFSSRLLIAFRMDDLAAQAEKTYGSGGSLAATTDFVSAATQGESDFLTATTDGERRTAAQAVHEAWSRFSGNSDDGLVDAVRGLNAVK